MIYRVETSLGVVGIARLDLSTITLPTYLYYTSCQGTIIVSGGSKSSTLLEKSNLFLSLR